MGFCIGKAAASVEITETITESLTLAETPVPKKIARLFLLSDILHNSSASVPNASSYRSHFQESLPEIFRSLHQTYKEINSRMGLETMKQQVTKVLHIWQAWSLFPLSFVARLERTMLYGSPDADAAEKAEARAAGGAAGDDVDGEDLDGEAMDDLDGEAMEDEDGEPMEEEEPAPARRSAGAGANAAAAHGAAQREALEVRVRGLSLRQLEAVCDANGLSSAGSRAEMVQRLLLALHAGASLDLDAKPEQQQTLAVASRWDDDDDDDAPAMRARAPAPAPADDIDGEAIDGEEIAPAASAAAEASLPKEVLRELEVKLMEFADKLEGKGHPREWVATQVAEQRHKLVVAAQQALPGGAMGRGAEAAPKEDHPSGSKPGEKERDRRERERAERRERERAEQKRPSEKEGSRRRRRESSSPSRSPSREHRDKKRR